MVFDVIIVVLSVSLLFYIFFLARLLRGLARLQALRPSSELPSVSVIIPARNEESAIGACVTSVLQQDYPRDRLKVIVVDDDSDDRTAAVVREIVSSNDRVTLHTMPHRADIAVGQKPESIRMGVSEATSDIVLTTDADCLHGSAWVRSMVAYFTPETAMVAGPVRLEPSSGLFGMIEELDFFGLIITSAGLIGAGRPIICNGANLAIRREAYNAVKDDVQVSSNDDGTLMSRIVTRNVGLVGYALRGDAVVRTAGKGSFTGFFRQRRRWASVRNRYLDWTIYAELGGLFLFFLSSLLALVLIPFDARFIVWALGAWGAKGLLDWIALTRGAAAMGVTLPLFMFAPALVFQPFGWVLATFLSVFSRFEWKGRRFDR